MSDPGNTSTLLSIHECINYHVWVWGIDLAISAIKWYGTDRLHKGVTLHSLLMIVAVGANALLHVELATTKDSARTRDTLARTVHYFAGFALLALLVRELHRGMQAQEQLGENAENRMHAAYVKPKKAHKNSAKLLWLAGKIMLLTNYVVPPYQDFVLVGKTFAYMALSLTFFKVVVKSILKKKVKK